MDKKILLYMVMICMFIISIQSSAAADIAVHPGESIQSAVDKASNGDNIIVYGNSKSGYTYKESIEVNKKVNIKSSGNVTIEAKNSSSAVFTVNAKGSGSSIQNFSLTKSNYCIVINNAVSCLISGNNIIGASLVGIQFYGDMSNSKVYQNKISGADHTVGNGISFEYGLSRLNNITGNVISNFLNGILFNDNSEFNTVENNQVSCTDFNGAGIYATDNSRSMNIKGNTVTGAEDGIAVQQMGTCTATNYLIDGNILKGNKNGFWIRLDNSTISNNVATYNTVSGLDITGRYNYILDNTASYNGNCGITLTGVCNTDHNTVNGNTLTHNTAGINSASYYSTYSNNNISYNNANGLIVTADHSSILGNKIYYNKGSGILGIGTCNLFKNNLIAYNDLGIYLQRSVDADYNTVSNNNIANNRNGINSASPYTNFISNTITNNSENGLIITSDHVKVDSNTLKSNIQQGLIAIGTNLAIINNNISYNNLGICLQQLTCADNNTVLNNNITNNKNGINSASPYTNFTSNTISYNSENGLTNNADHVIVKFNTIKSNNGCGILSIGTYNILDHNTVTGNCLGLCLQNATNADYNTISYNTISSNKNGINSACSYSIIKFNNLNTNSESGLIITGSYCNIYGNSMNHNGAAGITVNGIFNNVVQNNMYSNLYGASFSSIYAAVFNFNCVVGNTYQLYSPTSSSGVLNALNNWWGSNSAPVKIYGSFDVSKWLVLKLASVSSQVTGTTSSVVADLTHNSAGSDISSYGHVKDGSIVYFYCSLGTIPEKISLINGRASTTLKATCTGNGKISSKFDSQTLNRSISLISAIRSVNLANNAVNVSISKIITFTYNVPVKFGTNVFIELRSSSGKSVAINKSINGNVLTITHATLAKGTKYVLVIHTGSIMDMTNKSMPIYSIAFTTAK